MELKSQISTSRMAINKAKQAYIASKSAQKNRTQRSSRKTFDNEDDDWENIPEEEKPNSLRF